MAADYVWSVLNPQLDSRSQSEFLPRLIYGPEDGIPDNPGRHLVYATAAERFPEHVLILSHIGKFLAEVEKKFPEAEKYLARAQELEPDNEAVVHMLGKRYWDELKEIVRSNPPQQRSADCQARIDELADAAHGYFDSAREMNLGSEYNYTTPMQMNIRLIQDEFRRAGVASARDNPDVLTTERVATLLAHTEAIAAQGSNYLAPQDEKRRYFAQVRDEMQALRGDLETAIARFEKRIPVLSGAHLSAARIELARLYRERGERHWSAGKGKSANRDFETAQRHLYGVLEDPSRRYDNIRLWFDCARFLQHWTRVDLLDKVHQLHVNKPTLDSAFLLMCLYFADAIQTGSVASWRKYEEFQTESSRRSAPYSVRTFIREWLVEVPTSKGDEYRIFPNHLIGKEDTGDRLISERSPTDVRVTLTGVVTDVFSSTQARLQIEPMGFELFFKPRVLDRRFYKQDEGVARVVCGGLYV